MEMCEIKSRLRILCDEKYADFSAKLIPGFEREYFVGVRTPLLKSFAREIVRAGNYEDFLTSLPHEYFEENLLHAFILTSEKFPIDETIKRVERFLPYVDNWAVCDQFSVKLFAKYPEVIYPCLKKWMASEHLYTRRFGVVNSMRFFLDEKFEEIVGEINDEFDETELPYERIDEHTFIFDGKVLLADFYKIMNLDSDDFDEVAGEADSLAGLLLEIKGEFPQLHETLHCNGIAFEVMQRNQHRIVKIKVIAPAVDEQSAEKK